MYIRRPVPVLIEREFLTGRSSQFKKATRLIVGDILSLQTFTEDPVRINQEYGAKRAGCSIATFNKALKELQQERDGIRFIVQTENHRAGHNAKGYNVPPEALSEGFEWKTVYAETAKQLECPGHLVTEDTEAQRIHFRNIRTDQYLPAIEFLQRKEREGRLEVVNWKQVYAYKNAKQLAEALTDISALKIIDPKVEDGQSLLLELSFRFNQLHELVTGGADTFIFLHEQTQRIYSTFTLIPREFRKALRYHYTGGNYTKRLRPAEIAPYNGCNLVEVDVRNCQPLLLAALLKTEGIQARRMLQDTQEGTFHSAMMKTLGIDDKDPYKARLFHFLYGRPNDPTRAEFSEAFTDLYGMEAVKFIEEHKRTKGYKALPILLQRMESSAMIFKAARRVRHLHPAAPVLSVHDSLLIPDREEIQEATSLAIKSAFSELWHIEAKTNYEESKRRTNEG